MAAGKAPSKACHPIQESKIQETKLLTIVGVASRLDACACLLRVIGNFQTACIDGLQSDSSKVIHLAAQCEIPPPYRAIPFRDSLAEG